MKLNYTATLGGRQFQVLSDVPLTPEQVNSYAAQKLQVQQAGCHSCGGAPAKTAGGLLKLGTATCGGPYLQGSAHNFTGSITSGGTAPFTYTWTIIPPTGTPQTLVGATQTYTFTQAGTYAINLTVVDSCTTGGLTDSSNCNVTVTAACVNPACNIVIV